MSDMGEYWCDVKPELKKQYDERIAKTPDHVMYAIKQFEKHNIEYTLKNEATGHFHCRRKKDDELFQFWAGTGKILGYTTVRGIHALIHMLVEEEDK